MQNQKQQYLKKENLRPCIMQIVLSKTLKVWFLMEKIWEIGLKTKNLCTAKNTIKRKKNFQKWEEIFANHVYDFKNLSMAYKS